MRDLTYAILAVMLDRRGHSEEEIVARVKHFVPPEHAVRWVADSTASSRQYFRSKTRPGRELSTRKPDVEPEHVDPERAVLDYIRERMADLSRDSRKNSTIRYLERPNGDGLWHLAPAARERVRTKKVVAGAIALVLRKNLLLRGELI